jgi:hypothetical protein
LNNSNGPIHSNYKKNEQYWKEVIAAYISVTPKNRARLLKQVKHRFGRIYKRVQWFCGSWKEANALWASGESDADLMNKALNLYEEEHKKGGPFQFRHCWEVLRKEPEWTPIWSALENWIQEKESTIWMMMWSSNSLYKMKKKKRGQLGARKLKSYRNKARNKERTNLVL